MATVRGNKYSNVLDAADGVTNGSDIIFGYGGNDKIYALGGNDLLKGGAGADKLDGGSGIDTADYSDSTEGVEVSIAAGAGDKGSAEGDTLVRIENLNGSSYNDTLQGDDGANVLFGDAGNDILKGAGGADKLDGGKGNDQLNSDARGDTIIGGEGNDTLNYSEAVYGVSVNLGSGFHNAGYHPIRPAPGTPPQIVSVENVYGSNAHDNIIGSNVANKLFGNGGVDHISGFGGADTIVGGAGDDWLTGGGGNDQFVFGLTPGGMVNIGKDTILDFTQGEDRIKFDGVFDNFAEVQTHMHVIGDDVRITIDDNNTITLKNTQLSDMGASDFIFV
jgi:Ca2+-binding RTX toxin-like protein